MKASAPLLILAAAGAMALGAAAASLIGRPPSHDVQATVLSQPRPVPAFEMIADDRRPFGRDDLAGRWSMLFFGFTYCPDICPLTLRLLSEVDDRLEDLPADERLRVVFVSVDPQRDTPERLAEYVRHFDPAFVGITGSREDVDDLTEGLHVPYTIVPGESDDDYTVAHSAALFLVNPAGELAAVFGAPHDAETIAADYRAIRATSRL